MSSGNILKSWNTNQNAQNKVVIDANKRMITRLAEYEEQKRKKEEVSEDENEAKKDELQTDERQIDEDGFVPGLFAKNIDTFTDENGNLIYQPTEDDEVSKFLREQLCKDEPEEAETGFTEARPVLQGGMTAEAFQAQREELEKQEKYLEVARKEQARIEEDLLKRKEELELAEKNLEEQRQALEEEYTSRLEEAQKQAEEIMRTAKEEGFQKGYEEGNQKALEELENAKKDMEQHKKQLDAQYESQIKLLEPKFAEAFTGLYRHIFNVDFSKYKEMIPYLIMSTFRKMDGGRNLMIHVSKEDYPFVNLQKKQLQASAPNNATIEVVEDFTLKETECLIETDGGIFDCGLGTQLDELQKEIMVLAYKRG